MDRVNYRVRSRSEDGRMVFCVDDYDRSQPDICPEFLPHGFYSPTRGKKPQRSNSVCLQSENRPRKNRHSQRRSSMQTGRSRANTYSRPTPLGDGRRASVVGKKAPGKKRSSTGGQHREDSIRSTKLESQQAQIGKKLLNKPVEEDEQTRRHRRIATIVIGTFAFLLAASVLVVVVTLTHSSFHAPQIGNRELAKHRGQMIRYISLENNTLRKENEELINSLNRDMSVPENRTVTPT